MSTCFPLIRAFGSQLRLAVITLFAALAALSTTLVTTPAPLVVGAAAGLGLASTHSQAAISMTTATRQARCQALVTAAGSGARKLLYTSTRPASANSAATGTLLATLTFGATLGTCTAGVLTFDGAGVTQTAASHVAGTPGYARVTTSGGTVIYDIDVCGPAPCITFTGAVATGQNINVTGVTLTEGNP